MLRFSVRQQALERALELWSGVCNYMRMIEPMYSQEWLDSSSTNVWGSTDLLWQDSLQSDFINICVSYSPLEGLLYISALTGSAEVSNQWGQYIHYQWLLHVYHALSEAWILSRNFRTDEYHLIVGSSPRSLNHRFTYWRGRHSKIL